MYNSNGLSDFLSSRSFSAPHVIHLGVVDTPGDFITANLTLTALAAHHALSTNLSIVGELLDRCVDDIDDVLVADVGIVEAVLGCDSKGTSAILDELVLADCNGPCAAT